MNLKHNWSEICMPPRFHTTDKTIIVDNFNTLKQKRHLNHEPMSIEEVQRLLLEQDIPIEIAKELAVIILRDCFSAAADTRCSICKFKPALHILDEQIILFKAIRKLGYS